MSELSELRVLLETLRLALDRQRRAIGALDVAALSDATAEKRRLADEITIAMRGAFAADGRTEADKPARAELARIAFEVRGAALSNAALLADARHMIGHVLGTEATGAVYDSRARTSAAPRSAFAKAV